MYLHIIIVLKNCYYFMYLEVLNEIKNRLRPTTVNVIVDM